MRLELYIIGHVYIGSWIDVWMFLAYWMFVTLLMGCICTNNLVDLWAICDKHDGFKHMLTNYGLSGKWGSNWYIFMHLQAMFSFPPQNYIYIYILDGYEKIDGEAWWQVGNANGKCL